MQAQTTSRHPSNLLAWVIAGLGVALMVLLLLSFMADSSPSATSEVAGTTSNRVAYLQFGITADELRVADPATPDQSETLLTIPHAPQYGVLPAISPDGTQFAYTSLPESTSSPGPDSPAELWVTMIESGEPRLLAEGIDLLVPPVWTPDGEALVYRRSEGGTHTLAYRSAAAGEERVVAYSETDALFPVGFVNDGAGSLLYVGVNEREGSHLYKVALDSGISIPVTALSQELTREWTLSPDGSRIAFLEIAFTESEVASRASVVEIATGALTPMTSIEEAAFGPVWSDAGQLAIGTFNPGTGEASLLIHDGATQTRVEGPATGFDVPLAYNPDAGAYLVSTFENDSISSPGRSSLTLVNAGGERTTIAEGEVTLVGWTQP